MRIEPSSVRAGGTQSSAALASVGRLSKATADTIAKIMTAEGVSTGESGQRSDQVAERLTEAARSITDARYGSQVRVITSKLTTLIASASPLFIRNPVARIVWPRCAAGLGNTFIKLTSRVPERGGGA
jgi:hypothetical protein